MCLLSFVLFFQVNYKCNYGQSIYLSGNIDILGNWNPARALKLEWAEGHNWARKLKVMHDNTNLIEYKYFVASSEPGKPLFNIHWEFGPNRYVDLFTTSKLFVKLKDDWEHVNVRLALHHDTVKKYLTDEKRVVVYTNIGPSKSSHEMKLKKQMLKGGTTEDWFWMVSLNVPIYTQGFNYKYKIVGKPHDEVVTDRGHRKIKLKKFPHHANLSELYVVKCSTLVKYDFSFNTTLNYDAITDDIFVGAYPQTLKDVEDLAALGVKGVLNLQTFGDMFRFGIDWEFLQNCYKRSNVAVGHFPVPDMDFEELRLKIKAAADLLHELLKKGKVYVHCTAGRHRSPHVIIFYLCIYRGYDLKQAVNLVKSKRSQARVFEAVFPEIHADPSPIKPSAKLESLNVDKVFG